ncbi:hypothetical protein ASG43_20960 [Aureimonas sp. Leaf454]|uniref:hypothetical protein n=1 Tax=Aureimonas sp. Leaf454 TaxID=1736381 RepID=UPI0007010B7E|nr:hypothetical protein [Aureimonas sp. Leaf454]KQT51963.1 hypothetical protein ASG43_20960 [Aureimonas sp. Leaf454]
MVSVIARSPIEAANGTVRRLDAIWDARLTNRPARVCAAVEAVVTGRDRPLLRRIRVSDGREAGLRPVRPEFSMRFQTARSRMVNKISSHTRQIDRSDFKIIFYN